MPIILWGIKMLLPVNKERFLTICPSGILGLFIDFRIKEIEKARQELENRKLRKECDFDIITSDEFETLIDNPDYIRSDDPLAAIIGLMDKSFNIWKVMPLEMIENSLRQKFILKQKSRVEIVK
jgi:hypothetical protein